MKLYDRELAAFTDDSGKLTIMSVAIPKFLELVSIQVLGTINVVMLTKYSSDAVNAVNVATQVCLFLTQIYSMIIIGGSIIMNFELGRGDRKKASEVATTSVAAAFLFCLVTGVVLSFFSKEIMGLMNVSDSVGKSGEDYFTVQMLGLPISALMTFFSTFLICNGKVKSALTMSILSNVLNILFGYVVLFTDIPHLFDGTRGLSVANLLAKLSASVFGMYVYIKEKCPLGKEITRGSLKRVLRVGVPGGLSLTSYTLAQMITTAIIAILGMDILETKIYISSFVQYVSLFGYSVCYAGGIMCGRLKGRGDYTKIKNLTRMNFRIALVSNVILSIIALVFRNELMGIFTGRVDYLQLVYYVLLVDIYVEIVRAVNNAVENCLNAVGDVKIPLVASVCSCFLCSVLLGRIFSVDMGFGLVGCWAAFAVDETFKAIIYLIRFKSDKWKKINM